MNLNSISSPGFPAKSRNSRRSHAFAGRRCYFLLATIVLVLLAAPALQAQDTVAPRETDPPSRFSFGGRLGLFVNNLMNTETLTIASSDPQYLIQRGSSSTSGRLSGGATVEFAVADRVSVSLDILYRKVGYNLVSNTILGTDDPDTDDVDERLLLTDYESARANYWDIPLVFRFYHLGRADTRPRAFFDAGVAIRRVSNIRTFRRHVNQDGIIEEDETPITPANDLVFGAVFGGGIQFQGAGGIKVIPEARYTRWTSSTFDAPPSRSNRDQVEIMLGITF